MWVYGGFKSMKKHCSKEYNSPSSVMRYEEIKLPEGVTAFKNSKSAWCICRETHRHLWRFVVELPFATPGPYGVRVGENRCIISDEEAPKHMMRYNSYMDREELPIYRFLLEARQNGNAECPACLETIAVEKATRRLISHFSE